MVVTFSCRKLRLPPWGLQLLVAFCAVALTPCAAAHTSDLAGDGGPAWNTDPWLLGSFGIAAMLYAAGIGRLWRHAHVGAGVPVRCVAFFSAGIATLAVALLSPIDAMGARLFSVHMLQHELIMLVAAPLLVLGRPLAVFVWAFPPAGRRLLAGVSKAGAVQSTWRALMHPGCAATVHGLAIWAWHAPRLFQAGLTSESMHMLQHASFLLSALLFWSSLAGTRSRQAAGVLCILGTAIHTGVLGALLTFSTRLWYPAYAGSTAWGMTALQDQQFGGLIMWVPAGFLFIVTGLAAAAKVIAPAQVRRA